MSELSKMPNIGKTLEKRLLAVGVDSPEALAAMGAQETYIRLYAREGDTCFSTLCALEGAVQNLRWHNLDDGTKKQLRDFMKKTTGEKQG